MADLIFSEATESISPSKAGCSWTDGRATSTYQLGGLGGELLVKPAFGEVTIADIRAAITQILGDTSLAVGKGKLNRTLPKCHPYLQYDYASSIAQIYGVGKYVIKTLPAAANANAGGIVAPNFAINLNGLEAPPISQQYALYPQYNYDVVFTPRNYALLRDDKISVVDSEYFLPDLDAGGNPVKKKFRYATEWLRYTDFEKNATQDSVTATQGNMVFRDDTVKGQVYSGMPRMYLQNSTIKFFWYQVPYRYVTSKNCYLDKLQGTINQFDFINWPKGSLLYEGYNVQRRYTPPVQKLQQWLGVPGVFTSEKCCDLELQFSYTTRTTADTYKPKNPNWIVNGWNALPFAADRKFHYATSFDVANPANENKWIPSWFSSGQPFLLFTDPDAPQPD